MKSLFVILEAIVYTALFHVSCGLFSCLCVFSFCQSAVCASTVLRAPRANSREKTFRMGILMALTTVCLDVSLEGNVSGFIYQVQACVYV